ncbi:MAG: mitochondrial peripheral inner membrane protein [Cirrosporium novae-zelandiae]|nr:MAG: mitochondrial peripheral inner membrane protein [Cirrosporium novae-zelandiae]
MRYINFIYRRPVAAAVIFGFSTGSILATPLIIKQSIPTASLDTACFSPYSLVSKENISPTCCILTLLPNPFRSWSLAQKQTWIAQLQASWHKGTWAMEVKQPQLQVSRAYTPLPPQCSQPDNTLNYNGLQLLVRRYPSGEVSGYLHRLSPEDNVELRGPHEEFNIPDDVEEIVFLAGGTGISPALQTVHTLFEARQKLDVKVHILWANRERADCIGGENDTKPMGLPNWGAWLWSGSTQSQTNIPTSKSSQSPIISRLAAIKSRHPFQLYVDYYVDEEGTFIQEPDIHKALERSQGSKKLLLVSGPDGFISYLAGPKLWRDGKEVQGPLGGLLGHMELRDWLVWKL